MIPTSIQPQSLGENSERVDDAANNAANSHVLPPHLQLVTPLQIRLAFAQAFRAGIRARTVARNIRNRMDVYLYRLCPLDDARRLQEHCCAIQRLYEWIGIDEKSLSPRDVTATCAPKIPRFMLQLHIDEKTYRAYEAECRGAKESFVNRELKDWKRAKYRCQALLMHSEISPMERNVCVAWWTIFVTQMMKWEAKLDRFDLPDWHTAIGELTALIEERVDTEGFWEYDA